MTGSNQNTPTTETKNHHYNPFHSPAFHNIVNFFHQNSKAAKARNQSEDKVMKENFEHLHDQVGKLQLTEANLDQHYAYAVLTGKDLSKVSEIDSETNKSMAKNYAAVSAAINNPQAQQLPEHLPELTKIASNYIATSNSTSTNQQTPTSPGLPQADPLTKLETFIKQYVQLVNSEFKRIEQEAKDIFNTFVAKAPHSFVYQSVIEVFGRLDSDLYKDILEHSSDQQKAYIMEARKRYSENLLQLEQVEAKIVQAGKVILESAPAIAKDVVLAASEIKSSNVGSAVNSITDAVEEVSQDATAIGNVVNATTIAVENIKKTDAQKVTTDVSTMQQQAASDSLSETKSPIMQAMEKEESSPKPRSPSGSPRSSLNTTNLEQASGVTKSASSISK